MTAGVTSSNLTKTTVLGRLQKGLAASLFSHFVTVGHALLLTPLFLRAWGADGYGRWLALSALAGYLTLLDFGGQTYIGNLLAITYARGDSEEFRRHWEEGLSLYGGVALLAMALVGALLAWPALRLPGLPGPLDNAARWVLGLLSATNLLAIVGAVYMTPYRATGLVARGTVVGNLVRLLGLCVFAGALFVSVGLVGYAILSFAIAVIGTALIAADMRRALPAHLRFRLSVERARRALAHLRGSLEFWLIALALAINQQGVVLVVSAAVSPVAVALFATHRAMASLVGYAGALLMSPLMPELSFLWGQRRLGELGRATLLTIRVVALASAATILMIWVWLPLLYPVWTGRQLNLEPALLAVFLLQAMLFAGWSTSGWALLAANRHSRLAYWSVANAAVTIAAALLLVEPLGVLGVAAASLLGDLLCGAVVYPRQAARFLKISVGQIYWAMLAGGAAVLPVAGGIALISVFLPGVWFALASSLLGILCVYPVLLLALGKAETSRLLSNLRRLLLQRRSELFRGRGVR